MAAIYDLNRPNPLATPCDEESCKPPLVKILTSHEFSQLTHIAPEARAELAALELAAANFVELYPSYIIGSFSVPDKSDPTGDPDTMSFYLEADHLILIDDGDIAQKTLGKVAATGILTKPTTSHTLYAFMKTLIADDFSWFSSMEDAMESLEDAMIGHHADISSQTIMSYRRAAMRMGSYYQQIGVMADLIADNENKVMSREEARTFGHITTHANHLSDRADMLREYSLQLYELHQTQIDLKQNSTMQILHHRHGDVRAAHARHRLVRHEPHRAAGTRLALYGGHDHHPGPGHDRGDGAVLQAEEMALNLAAQQLA